MSSTFGGFTIAKLGIRSSQLGMQITGNNISNINTTGYTRQRINQISLRAGVSDRYASSTDIRVGMGSLVTSISQIRDPYLDIRFRNESSNVGYYDEKLGSLEDIQSILDEVLKDGVHTGLEEFRTQLENLANNVGSDEIQNTVREAASSIVALLNKYSESLDTHLEDAVNGLKQNVDEVNDILTQIRDLNEQIRTSQIHGDPALELIDNRNVLIDQLSEYTKIKVTYSEEKISEGLSVEKLTIELDSPDGKGGLALIDGIYSNQLEQTGPDANGNYDISLKGLQDKFGDSPLKNELEEQMKQLNMLTATIQANNKQLNGLKDVFDQWTDAVNANGVFDPVNDFKDEATITQKKEELQDAVNQAMEAYRKNPTDPALKQALDKARADQTSYNQFATQKQELDRQKNSITGEMNRRIDKLEELLKSQGLTLNKTFDPATGAAILQVSGGTLPGAVDLINGNNNVPKFSVSDGANDSLDLKLGNDTFGNKTKAEIDAASDVEVSLGDGDLYGRLQADLEHLNGEGAFEDPASDIRGIGYYKKSLDEFARVFAESLNAANKTGLDPADPNYNDYDLFTADGGGTITASNIQISENWLNGTIQIRPSTKPNPDPGDRDNTNIHNIIGVLNGDHTFENGHGGPLFTGSFEQMFTNMNAVLGTDMKTTTTLLTNYSSAATNRAVARDNISTVDLNEEGINLIQYQKSFSAACRVMTTLDEMLNSLLNM